MSDDDLLRDLDELTRMASRFTAKWQLAPIAGIVLGNQADAYKVMGANPATAAGMSNTEWLGHALYTQFLLPFEIAALILTVGVVAAVVLTLRHRTGVRHQQASQQVRVKAASRIRVVKMAAEVPAAPQPEAGKETTP